MTGSLILQSITSDDDLETAYRIRHAQWSNSIPFETFKHQRDQTAASYQKPWEITHWALVDKENERDESGRLNILSSLALYPRPSFLKVKGQPVDEKLVSQTIIMVVTPPQHRGNGYASKMLAETAKVIDKDASSDKINFSTLWSDVGEFYSIFGYKSLPAEELFIDISSTSTEPEDDLAKYDAQFTSLPDFSWFSPNIFDDFSKDDKAQILQDIEELTEKDGTTRVALIPDPDFYRFFTSNAALATARSHSDQVENPSPDLSSLSPLFKVGAKYKYVSVLWDIGVRTKGVTLVRVKIDSSVRSVISKEDVIDSIVVLLDAAVSQGLKWGLGNISYWKGDLPLGVDLTLQEIANAWNKKATQSAIVQIRKPTIPAIRLSNGYDSNVEWFAPGYYPWR